MINYVDYNFTELKAIPFSSVITRLGGSLERSGSKYRTKCVWHDDHHPSLVLYKDKNRCVCFACNGKKSRSVIDYVMQAKSYSFLDACEWLSDEFGVGRSTVEVIENNKTKKKSKPKKKKQSIKELLSMDDFNLQRLKEYKKEYSYIDMEYLQRYVSSDNSFCKCLKFIFPEEIVNVVTQLYMLGCYRGSDNPDDVLFPSIDSKLRVHNIKVQHYDCNPQSPQFFHCDKKHIFWLADVLKKRGMFKEDAIFDNTTLFGEHLLKDNPDMPVALVESPKNAVVGACEFPSLVWVAAGNKGNISRKSLSCLFNRDVLVLPDYDAIDEWKEKISKLTDIAAFTFSPFNENQLLECGAKGDIADWIIMKKRESPC